jgi:MurNAc alpha-1-phosphate uridylyltransferase
MLLAAGRGDRMTPLSSVLAKPALEVLGRPLLASSYSLLEQVGCSRIVVNLHWRPRQVAAAARAAARLVRPRFSWEPTLLGSAGGIGRARRVLDYGPVLVANGDVWADLDLSAFPTTVANDEIVLAVMPHPDPARWNSLRLAANGTVESIVLAGEVAPGEPFHFTGVQLLGAAVVAALPDTPAEMRPVWRSMLAHGRVRSAVVSGSWREAGTPAGYLQLIRELLAGGSWQHPNSAVAQSAEVVGSAIGAGCVVEREAQVESSVVTAGAIIARGCHVRRCIVAGPGVAPANARFPDSLLLPSGVHALLSPASTA